MPWTTHRSPASASRRSAEPRPSRATGDHATSGTARAGGTLHGHDRREPDHPVLRRAVDEAPVGADPLQHARDRPDPEHVEDDVGAQRRHQPPGQRDGGVLGAAAVDQVGLALGVVERLGPALEVVEEGEQALVPLHVLTLPRGGRGPALLHSRRRPLLPKLFKRL